MATQKRANDYLPEISRSWGQGRSLNDEDSDLNTFFNHGVFYSPFNKTHLSFFVLKTSYNHSDVIICITF